MFFDEVATRAWSTARAGSPVMNLLREIGFTTANTASVLGVASRQGGTLHGVMSFEREAGGPVDWSEADRHFALCLASFCTAALQARERLDAFARLRASEKHMAAELAEAERYVRRILPEPVESGHITTEWQIMPSEQVGGDSFGYHWINDNLFALYILDVVGHGTGAALLSISVLNTVRARLPVGEAALGSPARVLSELNEAFPMEQQNGMTFTMWYGVYDRRSSSLVYSSGGHPPAVLLLGEVPEGHADYLPLATEGPVLGGISGVEFTEERVSIPRGSKLYLCTDGAFEIPLGADREWTFEEFIATVRSTRWMDGGETGYLLKRIGALCSASSFPDDFCVVRFSFIL
jgi:sigma-B regulation protein RsbU (phosphoserine phosphatase)